MRTQASGAADARPQVIATSTILAQPAPGTPPEAAPAPVRAAVGESLRDQPREDPALLGAPADPVEAEPARPTKLAQNASSPWAKNFERAQKALWTNQPGGARTILNDVLRKPGLSRRDRARASKMMGDAEAKKNQRAKAIGWWRKAFQLYDDPEDRAKVARLIQGEK
jgi:hypothetical protein